MNTNPEWRTSTFSDGMQCVEVADLPVCQGEVRHLR